MSTAIQPPVVSLEEAERRNPNGKLCSDCREIKPIREFSPRWRGNYAQTQGRCKPCNSLNRRTYPI